MSSRFKITQISLAFWTLATLFILGIALLFVQSFAQPSWLAAWQYLFIGGIVAIVTSGELLKLDLATLWNAPTAYRLN